MAVETNQVLVVTLYTISCYLSMISSQCDLTCENVDDDIQEIVEQMDDLGYSVMSGQFELYNPEKSNVYIPFARPDSDYLVSIFEDGNVYYRFGGQDAIIWRGCTPPTVTYFGYRSYSAARILKQDNTTVPINFTILEASLGESINQLVINTESNDNTLFPQPFDRKTNIVTTGDEQTWTDIMNAYINAGLLNEMSLNLNPIPAASFLYSESEFDIPRDTITIIFEIISESDTGSINANISCDNELYLNQSFPFRIFYKDEMEPRQPMTGDLNRSYDGDLVKCETDPQSQIEDSFSNAIINIIDYVETKSGYTLLIDTEFDDSNDVSVADNYIFGHGDQCIANQVDCMFDNRDTYYSWNGQDQILTDDEFYLVVGLNHNNFSLSTINSISLASVTNPDNGNAFEIIDTVTNQEYEQFDLSDLIKCGTDSCTELEDVFAVQIGRPDNCLNTTVMPAICPDVDVLAADERFIFFAEAILSTRTKAKPSKDCLMPWRLLRFSITANPTMGPTTEPTYQPSETPTMSPTHNPTEDPTIDPTADPTIDPTTDPTTDPTSDPTADPIADPTTDPTADPTIDPTADPTIDPTADPTPDPTADPTTDPSADPTIEPTADPTTEPTADPTVNPTRDPTTDPTSKPAASPTMPPTSATSEPTTDPTASPTMFIHDKISIEDVPKMPAFAWFTIVFSGFCCVIFSISIIVDRIITKRRERNEAIYDENITIEGANRASRSYSNGSNSHSDMRDDSELQRFMDESVEIVDQDNYQ